MHFLSGSRRRGISRHQLYKSTLIQSADRSLGDTDEPNHILAGRIGPDVAQWRAGAGEVRLACPEHEWPEVKAIFVAEPELRERAGELGSRDVDVARDVRFQPAHERLEVALNERR